MNDVLIYLWDGFLLTVKELALLFGPGFVLGLVLHFLAEIIRASSLRFMGVNMFVWLTAPGTIIHELGHAFFCLLFGHSIKELSLFRPSGKESLGHVKHAYNPYNPYHMLGHFFIGTGPLWFGAAALYGLSVLFLGRGAPLEGAPAGLSLQSFAGTFGQIGLYGLGIFGRLLDLSLFKHWQVYVFLYLGVSIGAHMTLSVEDLGGALKGFVVLLALALLMNWGTAWAGDWSDAVVGWLFRPLYVVYGVMCFAVILIAALTLPVALLGGLAGERRDGGRAEK